MMVARKTAEGIIKTPNKPSIDVVFGNRRVQFQMNARFDALIQSLIT